MHLKLGMSIVVEVGDPEEWTQDPTNQLYKCGEPQKHESSTQGDKSTVGAGSRLMTDGLIAITIAALALLLS